MAILAYTMFVGQRLVMAIVLPTGRGYHQVAIASIKNVESKPTFER